MRTTHPAQLVGVVAALAIGGTALAAPKYQKQTTVQVQSVQTTKTKVEAKPKEGPRRPTILAEQFRTEATAKVERGAVVDSVASDGKVDYTTVYFEVANVIAPTTPEDRMELIARRASGFIYYVSREGVTGMQTKVADTIGTMTAKIRAHTKLPIAIGFGISNPEQARTVAQSAEAIVVGSAVVNQIAEHGQSPELVARVSAFVKSLGEAVKSI